MATAPSATQNDLQKTFIAMLFAFAVSVVAQQISELLIVITNNWQLALAPTELYDHVHNYVLPLIAVATHLTLALLMLSVSWVMWSRSKAAGHVVDIKEIFSIKFITFLFEVLLVTLYYSLTKSSEGDFSEYSKTKSVAAYVSSVTAKPEALQMFCIFLIFAIWDLIVDVVESPKNPVPSGAVQRTLGFFSGIFVYCAVSVLCAIGALIVGYAADSNGTSIQAIAGDVALVATLLLFNQGKILEHYLCNLIPSERSRNNTKKPPTLMSKSAIAILLLIYISSLLTMLLPCLQK